MSGDTAVVAGTGQYAEWLSSLDTYGVQYVVLDRRRDGEVLQLIRSQPDWTIDFEDQEAVLLARKGMTGDESGAFAR